jgi:hypothetical protein
MKKIEICIGQKQFLPEPALSRSTAPTEEQDFLDDIIYAIELRRKKLSLSPYRPKQKKDG